MNKWSSWKTMKHIKSLKLDIKAELNNHL